MDTQKMQRRMRMQNAIEQSAYTLALAKNQNNPDIKASMDRIDDLEKAVAEQQDVMQKLQRELQSETEALKAMVKPFTKKELEGLEDAE